ncbi:CehA/McbA family metallohydrolase [Ponticoccus sp. SC2-23]|uniref:CehA/McbA family metallohydrolase n=1 Tax=Alexandriicola marinus TaxID=2081710 RepID=UPI0013DE97D8|nr:CehA/McbA family metallohydrolase [Alexandriicola marinus]MBM1221440.1 CehA/McbA family metallohydrolase [Ponticoccus sp. SC6-9]MBM1226481.1 CehA/McbA family metallohydrolase [Ponticoccus sp. SC6-15]MBM1230432.1 CehA/McbA family metallohydrolase [Ponticoccus sp. SC6-38]MBM1234955.1 CehA/McbA family metallohydrolase [Ponticoccus sp. SC6-45]MBM1239453.1 CehA/McbA family metallohydrolase [Ponticoccus sp. SC6-49]MBM1243235.1 CehA/McbA family metallohydrolase [Ponticoccus sp. SC2-64]MBM1248479
MIEKRIVVPTRDETQSNYAYAPIPVPEGISRIDVAVEYDRGEDCAIDLGLADPRFGVFPSREGFRGWSGSARDRFFVASDDATPGYLPGPMPAGDWQLILGLYRVPAGGTEIIIRVSFDAGSRGPWSGLPAPVEVRREAEGWYRGDLHCHCWHSDAAGSPETLHAAARQAGLDFLAVSDHNTVSHRRYFLPRSTPDLLFLRAMEVTTYDGHANAFGTDGWVDFRIDRPEDVQAMAHEVRRQGGVLSINHDKPGLPWLHDWPGPDCMEVWQHPWLARNWISLEKWQHRLAAGERLPAIGGSDWHQPADLRPEGPYTLARPTTVLHLPELTEASVLEAMKAGRGYITEAPDGPHLDLRIGEAWMGETARPSDPVRLDVRGANGDILTLHDAGGKIAAIEIAGDDVMLTPDVSPRGFLRAEIIAAGSRDRLLSEFRATFPAGLPWGLTEEEIAAQPLRRALSNPIWFDRP